MKARDGKDYFHIATVHDDSGRVALQDRPLCVPKTLSALIS
jgi:hypothetical protein